MDESLYDAADVHNILGDGESFAEKAGDWVTKGVPAALASGVVSVLNTGVAFGNMFGDFEKIDTEDTIRKFDDNVADYYSEHKEGADLGGFLTTSLVPGVLGVKGLKALQTIKDGGIVGKNVAAITGYAASVEQAAIKKAAETVAGETNLIWGTLNAEKVKAIAAGFGEQALQGLAFEAGVLLTMNQNPVINPEEKSYFGSIWHNLPQSLENTAIFGGIGGVLNAAKVTGEIKNLIRAKDNEYFASLHSEVLGDVAMTPGTKATWMFDHIKQRESNYELLLQEATIDEKFLKNYERTTAKAQTELDKFITTKLAKGDADLAESIRLAIKDIKPTEESGYMIKEQEKLARVFGSAENAKRLGVNELEGNERIIKLAGDERGAILERGYAAPGDLGPVEVRKDGRVYINGDYPTVGVKFNPLENSPTDSSIQFLQANLGKELKQGVEIPLNNLPLLERAAKDGTEITVDIGGVKNLLQGSEVTNLLREQKLAQIQELVNNGKDLDYISRALNVPKEFINSKGKQGELSLYAIEDHTKPLYANVAYQSKDEMNKFAVEGMLAVYEKRKLAQSILDNAAAKIFGEELKYFDKSKTLVNVTTMPEMAGLFKATDPAYGSTGSKFAQDGKMVDQIVRKWATARSDLLHGAQEEVLKNPEKLVEMNVVVSKMRASDSDWVKLPDEVYSEKAGEFILIKEKVLNEILKSKMPQDALSSLTNNVAKDSENIIRLTGDSPVAKYLETLNEINAERVEKFNTVNAAKGSTRKINPEAYYVPPIENTLQPYLVMVLSRQPLAGGDNPFSFVVAPSAEALEKKVSKIKNEHGDKMEIFSPKNVQDKKIIDGVYDSGDFFQKTAIDSEMKRMGLLTDFMPRTDGYIFQEFDNYLYKKEQALARQGVEALRSDEFAQLRALADNYGELLSAKFGGKKVNDADNPYLQLINTALNVSNKGHYDAYWGAANRGVSKAWNAISSVAKDVFGKANKGELTAEQANAVIEQHGWRAPYGDVLSNAWNPVIPDPNALGRFVNKANLAISTLMLRMDALNSVINTISLPILMKAELTSIKRNLSDPTLVGKLNNLMREQVPGSSHSIPSLSKLLFDGAGNYIKNPDVGIAGINKTMHEYFVEIGAIKTDPQLLRAAMDAVPLTEDAIKSKDGIAAYVTNLTKRVGEFGAKYSGNNLAEDFVRFQAAHAMLQVAKTAGITSPAELASYINTYVNRVHGNYLASQRPALFSGPIGQAIGLFQTYQFNMIQQMTRYIQQGDKSAVVAAAALQNTIFGLQGNPLFYQLNNYIGNSKRQNQDIVSGVDSLVGSPELGKANPARWLMYGLGANSLQVNLYSRGDLTPRYATVVPDRLQDIPLISIPTKAIGSFLDSMSMINKGAGVTESILHGVAHSGFNRPLAGLAGLAQGARTTSQGTLLNAYNDIDGLLVAATLAGGRQLNEAVLVDQYYRQQAYHSAQTRRIKEVSEAVKLTSASQKGILNPDQTSAFLSEYVKEGGQLSRANQWLMRATKDSQVSVVNQMKNNYHSPFGKRMRDMMGAEEDSIQNISAE